ncbi:MULTISPECIES: HNH endonuclease [Vitreoscilla]|uniref:HNH endonuclease n=1 Tax=Vitreoscilla stercoraria TaxID=61 RepID=A0ABY4E769_VITST|nr:MULTISPECIES: HNH endonuclease [Vitreoscilla]AUZ04700.2 hypothetical protein ADP71_09910 [Vitreoscilla sp. C1]UOO91614.1 HNH endonuclease [Vitreoscilla stercoraria]
MPQPTILYFDEQDSSVSSEPPEVLYLEGARKTITVNAYERHSKARQACLDHYGYQCQVCGFDFERQYGAIGKNFIHVHHREDLACIEAEYQVNPMVDLVPVCPNCHAMLHQKKPAYSIDELKVILKQHDSMANLSE